MSFYSKLDILGEPFSLTLKGEKKLQSWFGATLTLLFIAAVIASAVIFIRNLFDYSTPLISQSNLTVKKGITVDFANLNMLPFIRVRPKNESTDEPIGAEEASKYFTPYLSILFINEISDGVPSVTSQSFDGVPCSDLSTNKTKFNYLAGAANYKEVEDHINWYGYCFDIKDKSLLKLTGNGTAAGSRSFQIDITPCEGELDCKTNDINNYSLEIVFPEYSIDYKDHDNPVKLNIDIDKALKVEDFTLFRIETLRPVKYSIYDENQLTTKEAKVGEFVELETLGPKYGERPKDNLGEKIYSCNIQKIDDPGYECFSLYQVNIVNSQAEVKYLRRYKLVTQVLSEIGGISTLLLQVFTYLNMVYLYFAREGLLTRTLFPSISSAPRVPSKSQTVPQQPAEANPKEAHSKWKQLRTDAVKLIDSSIDLSVLFEELCVVRLLGSVLIDDMQRALVTLSTVQVFREQQTAEEQKEKAMKSASSTPVVTESGPTPVSAKLQNEAQLQQHQQQEAIGEIMKRHSPDPLQAKIDFNIKRQVALLSLPFLASNPDDSTRGQFLLAKDFEQSEGKQLIMTGARTNKMEDHGEWNMDGFEQQKGQAIRIDSLSQQPNPRQTSKTRNI